MPGGVEPTTHYNDTTGDWTRNLHLERVMCLTYSTMVPNNGINITKKYFFLVCILNIEWSANSIETRNINTAMFFADILVSIPCTVFSVLPLPLSIAACRTHYYCPCTTPEDSRFQYFFQTVNYLFVWTKENIKFFPSTSFCSVWKRLSHSPFRIFLLCLYDQIHYILHTFLLRKHRVGVEPTTNCFAGNYPTAGTPMHKTIGCFLFQKFA